MNTKFAEYVVRQLAATGFAVIDHVIARELTHDLLWATANNNLGDFTQAEGKLEQFLRSLPGVDLCEVRFVGDEAWRVVAFRSDEALPDRILWITGRNVAAVRAYDRPHSARNAENAKKRPTASDDEPPPYPCMARTEWFEQRGQADPLMAKPIR